MELRPERLRDVGPRARAREHRGLPRRARRASRQSSRRTSASRYCNGGYVVLALIAERASGTPFHELVRERVCEPAGMVTPSSCARTSFPGVPRSAISISKAPRAPTCFHLPVRGTGDGGIYSTVGGHRAALERVLRRPDRARRLGRARWCGRAVTCRRSRRATASASGCTSRPTRCGSAAATPACPATASTTQATSLTYTVLSNTTGGAWPIARLLNDRVAG